jgi:hypothetical protein
VVGLDVQVEKKPEAKTEECVTHEFRPYLIDKIHAICKCGEKRSYPHAWGDYMFRYRKICAPHPPSDVDCECRKARDNLEANRYILPMLDGVYSVKSELMQYQHKAIQLVDACESWVAAHLYMPLAKGWDISIFSDEEIYQRNIPNKPFTQDKEDRLPTLEDGDLDADILIVRMGYHVFCPKTKTQYEIALEKLVRNRSYNHQVTWLWWDGVGAKNPLPPNLDVLYTHHPIHRGLLTPYPAQPPSKRKAQEDTLERYRQMMAEGEGNAREYYAYNNDEVDE